MVPTDQSGSHRAPTPSTDDRVPIFSVSIELLVEWIVGDYITWADLERGIFLPPAVFQLFDGHIDRPTEMKSFFGLTRRTLPSVWGRYVEDEAAQRQIFERLRATITAAARRGLCALVADDGRITGSSWSSGSQELAEVRRVLLRAGLISAERTGSLFGAEEERRIVDPRETARRVLQPALDAAGVGAVVYWPSGFPPDAPVS